MLERQNPEARVAEIVAFAEARCEDVFMKWLVAHRAQHPDQKIMGHLPIYVPRELAHAAGMLPVGIMGGGDQLEIIRGDAYFQSYICHIPRSVIELGLAGAYELIDAFVFPSICDVIRNLSGMWKFLFSTKAVKYLDVPQNFRAGIGGEFYERELRSWLLELEAVSGRKVADGDLWRSIELYNANRAALLDLYALRRLKPWVASTVECYSLTRLGVLMPVAEHTALVREYLDLVPTLGRKPKDCARVILQGAFCEQPPLNLLKTIEAAGCYLVDDDLILGTRWCGQAIVKQGSEDAIHALSRAFLTQCVENASKYLETNTKGADLVNRCRAQQAEGVIFCAASFCDPALLDQPMQEKALAEAGIPMTAFKFSEDLGQFQVIREQTGTFADSIKLWGTT